MAEAKADLVALIAKAGNIHSKSIGTVVGGDKIKKGKKERYVVSDQEKIDVLAELGLGSIKLKLQLNGSEVVLEEDRLKDLMALVNSIASFERKLPPESGITFENYLAEARAPKMDLPLFWLRHKGQGEFLDTRANLDARLEKIRADADHLVIYEGRESGLVRDEADVEVYTLHVGEKLTPLLLELQNSGLSPDLFNDGGSRKLVVHSGSRELEQANLLNAFRAIQGECEKDVVIQRYKGLGEMNGSQLFESTMDPTKRTLARVSIDDDYETDMIFTVLMGPNVEPRREFIEKHALEATNLDY